MIILILIAAIWAMPALIDLFEAIGYAAGKVATIAKDKLVKFLTVYLAILAVLVVAGGIAMAAEQTLIFAVIMFLIGCVLLPANGLMNKSISLINHVLPNGSKMGDPKVITISALVSINLGLVALLFPAAFYSWFGIFMLALMMVGVAVIFAFPSDRFLSRVVLGSMAVATFVLWIAMAVFPTEIEAAVNWRKINQANSGRKNVAEMLKIRPVQKVIADTAALWTVKKRWNGDPVLRSDGFPVVTPLNKSLTKGQLFKTSNVEVRGLDAGEPMVQIFLPAADGSWVQTGEIEDMYIAVSKTDLPTTQISSNDTAVTNSSSNNSSNGASSGKKSMFVDATNSAGVSSGFFVKSGTTVKVSASGTAVWKNIPVGNPSKYEECGPDGTSSTASKLISKAEYMSNMDQYLCPTALKGQLIAKVGNGSWFPVGSNYKGEMTNDGNLVFAINDLDPAKQPVAENWGDNSKGFQITVEVK